MTISVLISVYESEKPEYLEEALYSIWDKQIHKPNEIVLIQDGPISDDLKIVLNNWRTRLGSQLKFIENKENLGLTKSLNKGLKVASGNYIARMDSDDISLASRFQMQKDYLDRHPDVAIIGGALQEFDSEHDCLAVRHYPINNEEVLNYVYKASPLAHPTVMMRKNIFDNGLSYNEEYRTSQDIALWFDVLSRGYKIANLEEVVIKFRRDKDIFNRRSKQKAKNELKIYINGIRQIYGLFTWKYIYPIARYCFRMMPISVVKYFYDSNLRKKLLH